MSHFSLWCSQDSLCLLVATISLWALAWLSSTYPARSLWIRILDVSSHQIWGVLLEHRFLTLFVSCSLLLLGLLRCDNIRWHSRWCLTVPCAPLIHFLFSSLLLRLDYCKGPRSKLRILTSACSDLLSNLSSEFFISVTVLCNFRFLFGSFLYFYLLIDIPTLFKHCFPDFCKLFVYHFLYSLNIGKTVDLISLMNNSNF